MQSIFVFFYITKFADFRWKNADVKGPAYIALNTISTFLRQFVPGNLANFAGGTIIFFMFAALIISSLAAVPDGTVAHSLFSRNFFTPILL